MTMPFWLQALLSDIGAPRQDSDAITGPTSNDPLPELSVHGCIVFYAGYPIYEAASPEAAVAYRDRQINFYI